METFAKLFERFLVFVYHCFDRIVIQGYLPLLTRPEHIVHFFRDVHGQYPITKKVLAAIPDAQRDFRPDPNARSAWELAWHIAKSDVHLMDSIANLKFDATGVKPDEPETVAELVVRQPDYLTAFAAEWSGGSGSDLDDWKNWARWRLIHSRASLHGSPQWPSLWRSRRLASSPSLS